MCPALVLAALVHLATPAAYDPLAVTGALPQTLDLSVHDVARSREIPIRVYLPSSPGPNPVILYSHGLGGSKATSAFLGQHWAGHGYVAVFVQHPGSDESVWIDQPPRERLAALTRAANLESFLARVKDIPAVLDALTAWNADKGHPLAGRLDLAHVGMSGHSFGAVTTEAVSGETMPIGKGFTDPRIRAALVMSPSVPRREDPAKAFGQVKIPWLLMTGTRDVAPIGGQTAESRLAVFPALPPGHKYELVLDGAEHPVFTDRALPMDVAPRNPRHHPAILALSTAFFDAYLRENAGAKAWLDGGGPRSVLEPADRWSTK